MSDTYILTKTDRFAKIMSQNISVPVNKLAEMLEVKRPNIYKMVQTSPNLSHLVIDKGIVINKLKQHMSYMDAVPEYVVSLVTKDPDGFIRLAMNWDSLDLDIVANALRNEDFTIESLNDLTDEHVCAIIRMLIFYLLERKV